MWNPLDALASRPWRVPVMITGPNGFDCSNVTVPVTSESPLSTVTA